MCAYGWDVVFAEVDDITDFRDGRSSWLLREMVYLEEILNEIRCLHFVEGIIDDLDASQMIIRSLVTSCTVEYDTYDVCILFRPQVQLAKCCKFLEKEERRWELW